MLIENEEGWFDAILRSDYTVVQNSLIRYKGTKSPSGLTGLMYSAMRNDYRMVHVLKQYEAGCCDNKGYTALMLAAEADNAEVCLCLLDLEGHILLKDRYTAYDIAQWSRSYAAMRAMAAYYSKEPPPDTSVDSESSGELIFKIETVASIQEYNVEQVKKIVTELSEAYVQLDSLQSLVVRQRDELKALLNANTVLRDVFIRQNNEMKQLESLLHETLQDFPAASLICSQREELDRLRLQIASLTIAENILDHKVISSPEQKVVESIPTRSNQSTEVASLMKENTRLRSSMTAIQSQISHILLRHDPLLISSDEAARVASEAEIALLRQELELKNGTISILTEAVTDLKAKFQIECKSVYTSITIPSDDSEENAENVPKDLMLTDENGNIQQLEARENDAISLLFNQLEEKENTILDLSARLLEQKSLLERQIEQFNTINQDHTNLIQSLKDLVHSISHRGHDSGDTVPYILKSISLLLKEEPVPLSPIISLQQIANTTNPHEYIGIPSVVHSNAVLYTVSESPKLNSVPQTDLSSILEDSQSMTSPFSPTDAPSGIPATVSRTTQDNDLIGLDLNAPYMFSSPSTLVDNTSSIYKLLEQQSPVNEPQEANKTIDQLKDKVAEQERLIDEQRLKIHDLEELNLATNTSRTSKMIATLSLQLEEARLSKLSIEDELRKSKEQLAELEKCHTNTLESEIEETSSATESKAIMLELKQVKDENEELSKLVHILDAKLAEYENTVAKHSSESVVGLEQRLDEKVREVENLLEMIPLLKAKDLQIIQLTEEIALNRQAEHDLLVANDTIAQLSKRIRQLSSQPCQMVDQSIMVHSLILSSSASVSDNLDTIYEQTTHLIRDRLDVSDSTKVLTLTQTDKHAILSDSDTVHLSSVLMHLDAPGSANSDSCILDLQLESQLPYSTKEQNNLSQEYDTNGQIIMSDTSTRLNQLEELCNFLKTQNTDLQDKLSIANEQIANQILAMADTMTEESPRQCIHELQLEIQEKNACIQQLQNEVQRARDASDSIIKNRQDLQIRNVELQDELLDVSAQLIELRRTILQREDVISKGIQTVNVITVHSSIQSYSDRSVQTIYQSTPERMQINPNPEDQSAPSTIGAQLVPTVNTMNDHNTDPSIVSIMVPRNTSQLTTIQKQDMSISATDLSSEMSPADSIVTLSGIQYTELLQSICGGNEDDIPLDSSEKHVDIKNSIINQLSLSKTLSNSLQKYTETDRITLPTSLVQTVQHLSVHIASMQSKLYQSELLNRSLRHELLEAEAVRDIADNTEDELTLHRNEIKYLRDELASKENQICTVTTLLNKAESQLQERTASLEQNALITNRATTELLDLRQQESELRDENHKFRIELESTKRKLELETSRGLQLEKELSSITSELQETRREQLQLRTSASQLANENLALTALIAQTQTDTTNTSDIALSGAIETLESEKHELQDKLNRTVHSFINLKSHMDDTTAALNKQLHDIEQQLISTKNHLSEYKESYEQLSKEHDGALQRLDNLSETNKKLRMFIADKKLDSSFRPSSNTTSSINKSTSYKGESNNSYYRNTILTEHPDDTPLMRAVLSNAPIGALRRQLRHVGCVRPDGTTALMLASQMGNTNAVSVLREYESGVERADGATALDLAMHAEQIEVIRLLLPFEKPK